MSGLSIYSSNPIPIKFIIYKIYIYIDNSIQLKKNLKING